MKRLNVEQWRESGDRSDAILLKSMDTVVTQVEESNDRVLNFVISNETVDSYNDVVKADGWDLSRYEKNPVVLWAHDSRQPPVAKASSIGVAGKNLVASAEFADAETYAFADTVYRLLKGKFLRATSVGFFPREWTYDEERGGYNLIKNELFEFSIVPVPANPEALQMALKSGIDCAPLRDWAEMTLDMWEPKGDHDRPPVSIWVPKSQIESVYKSLTPEVVSVTFTMDRADSGNDALIPGPVTITFDEDEEAKLAAEEAKLAAEDAQMDEFVERLPETVATMSDEIEGLKAQIDQLMIKLNAQPVEPVDDSDDLSAVIDLSFDTEDVEDEISRSIVDLELEPEELQNCIRRHLEHELMKKTGKLPKEV